MDDTLFALSIVISGLIAAVVGYLSAKVALMDVTNTANMALRNSMGALGRQGIDARAKNSEEMEAALIEAAAIMQNPEIQDKTAALAQLGMKYPNVARRLIQKGLKM